MEQSLWRKVAAAGQRASDKARASQVFQRASPALGTAFVAGEVSNAMIRALAEHIEELERRLTENPLEYRGIWKPDQAYAPRSFVTSNGQVWFTAVQTSRKPGEGDWVLAVRKGADAR